MAVGTTFTIISIVLFFALIIGVYIAFRYSESNTNVEAVLQSTSVDRTSAAAAAAATTTAVTEIPTHTSEVIVAPQPISTLADGPSVAQCIETANLPVSAIQYCQQLHPLDLSADSRWQRKLIEDLHTLGRVYVQTKEISNDPNVTPNILGSPLAKLDFAQIGEEIGT